MVTSRFPVAENSGMLRNRCEDTWKKWNEDFRWLDGNLCAFFFFFFESLEVMILSELIALLVSVDASVSVFFFFFWLSRALCFFVFVHLSMSVSCLMHSGCLLPPRLSVCLSESVRLPVCLVSARDVAYTTHTYQL